MKRSQVIFVAIVVGALLAGFLTEHGRVDDPIPELDLTPAPQPKFEPLEVPAGEHRLAGRVIAVNGEPAPDVQVFLYGSEPQPGRIEPLHWTFTDADGHFEIEELRAAEYRVALMLPGHPTRPARSVTIPHDGEVAWTLPAALGPLPVLPTIERADLVGQLFSPIGLTVEQYPVEGYEILALPRSGNHPLSGAVVRRTRSDAEGRFEIADLVAADYRIVVLPMWAAGGSWPFLDEVVHRHEPEPPRGWLLRLRLRCGELAGSVADPGGRPIQGALIKVWEAGNPDRLWPPTATDAKGRFLVRDLPTGRYVARARAGAEGHDLEVRVEAGTRLEVTFEPIDPSAKPSGP